MQERRKSGFFRSMHLATTSCVFLLVMLVPPAKAQCTRSDVDYYLEKGFSKAQVASICGTRTRAKKLPIKVSPPTANEPKIYRDLRRLLPMNVVEVTSRTFSFVAKFCVRKHTCPEVFHRVYFHGLKVIGSSRQYGFFGPHLVELRGKIHHKVLTSFSDMSSSAKERLIKRLRSVMPANEVHFEVRNEKDSKQAIRILKILAQRAAS